MVACVYGPLLAYDPTTGELVPAASGQVYDVDDTAFATPLAVTDLVGTVMSAITSDSIGVLDEFVVQDEIEVNWKSGSYVIHLTSFKGAVAQITALVDAAQTSASDSATVATAASTAAAAAAAAAQAAQTQVETYIASGGGSGGGGLDATALDTRMGGNTAGLIDRMIMPRLRTSGGTGAWEARPDCLITATIGVAPKPTDMAQFDLWFELP